MWARRALRQGLKLVKLVLFGAAESALVVGTSQFGGGGNY